MAKVGRKPIQITKKMIEQTRNMAAAGCDDKQIYAALGWSHQTFYRKRKNGELSELDEVISEARAQGIAVIANAHFQAAKNGNVKAQQFFLSTRGGFHHTQQIQALDEKGERMRWSVEFVNADMVPEEQQNEQD